MHPKTPAFALALALLGACGGGGGDSQVPLTTVAGPVAANVPLAGYLVTVCAPISPPPTSACLGAMGTAGPDGRYSATSNLGDRRPFFIGADSQGLGTNGRHYPRL